MMTKKKDKMRDLKKDGKHVHKYDAVFCWLSDQDVGQKTDESRFISKLQQATFCNLCFKGKKKSEPQGVNLPVFEVNHPPTTSIKLTIHGSILSLPHTPTWHGV